MQYSVIFYVLKLYFCFMEYRDERLESAYGEDKIDLSFANNKYILKWWSKTHDELIFTLIQKLQWHWFCEIHQKVEDITPKEVIKNWVKEDPICKEYVWYNVIAYFAEARAKIKGMTKDIRKPKRKKCGICQQDFNEDSLGYPLVIRLGIDDLDFCAPCLKNIIYPNSGIDDYDEKKIIKYLKELANILQRVPTQGFGERIGDLHGFTKKEKFELITFMKNKPSITRIKYFFGSWFKALIAAGILEDGTRKNSRGIQCLAKDGDVCYSLGEKTIDDLLYSLKIKHKKECYYPESNYRSDFLVNDVHIEYFGLAGNKEYDKKTKEKIKLCKMHGLKLLAIYPKDLLSYNKLKEKITEAAL